LFFVLTFQIIKVSELLATNDNTFIVIAAVSTIPIAPKIIPIVEKTFLPFFILKTPRPIAKVPHKIGI